MQQAVALLELHERDCWFQQDRATCCTTSGTMNMRSVFLGDRLISKSICSPRFPDLTSPDFFFCGHVKEIPISIISGHSHNTETRVAQLAQSCGIVPARERWTLQNLL